MLDRNVYAILYELFRNLVLLTCNGHQRGVVGLMTAKVQVLRSPGAVVNSVEALPFTDGCALALSDNFGSVSHVQGNSLPQTLEV